MGKTSLAAQAAREVSSGFLDGVVFVDLAPLGDPGLVTSAISSSLGLREVGAGSTISTVLEYLRGKEVLLVLDNFEHVLGAAPQAAALVEACKGLTVLVTSRAPLRVRGEQEYPVEPLALPPSTVSACARDVAASASAALFAERARAASPSFSVTEGNAGAVASICWRLSGLPLALELAAAKARFLDAATLLSRLDGALLSGDGRGTCRRGSGLLGRRWGGASGCSLGRSGSCSAVCPCSRGASPWTPQRRSVKSGTMRWRSSADSWSSRWWWPKVPRRTA